MGDAKKNLLTFKTFHQLNIHEITELQTSSCYCLYFQNDLIRRKIE